MGSYFYHIYSLLSNFIQNYHKLIKYVKDVLLQIFTFSVINKNNYLFLFFIIIYYCKCFIFANVLFIIANVFFFLKLLFIRPFTMKLHYSSFNLWNKWFLHTINQYTTKNSPLTVNVTTWPRHSVWSPMRILKKFHALKVDGITCPTCYMTAYVDKQ